MSNSLPPTPFQILLNYYNKDKYDKINNDIEHFSKIPGGTIGYILQLILSIIAIYFSFECGFDLVQFLIACCCPICYIIYVLIKPLTCQMEDI